MNSTPAFLIDSDVLITAKNRYYAFDICPGFWSAIIHNANAGRVGSIDRIRGELTAGTRADDLSVWVVTEVPGHFFLSTDSEDIVAAFTEVMLWVQRNPQYTDAASAKFASGHADALCTAHAVEPVRAGGPVGRTGLSDIRGREQGRSFGTS